MKKEALLWGKLDQSRVHCYLCAHHCHIADSSYGVCSVRQNIDGTLYTLFYGDAIAAHVDLIEKKPFYHFLPGSYSFSIATVGCNFQCAFCQNWQISQMSKEMGSAPGAMELMPEMVIKEAVKNQCRSISYTYTEPTIFFEYALDTARLAKGRGIYNVFVTNGYMTKQAIDTISPFLDAANVDLKSFSESYYRKLCKAKLKPVLDSIAYLRQKNVWVEITTLVIPGKNDSPEEMTEIADFIASVDRDVPWHISRFHPDYKLTNSQPTPLETMEKARDIGKKRGLRYVYLGNVMNEPHTYCPYCGNLLISRRYFGFEKSNLSDGKCPHCEHEIKGVW
jgi:pyruvate formate lyase activating enzyme